MVLLAAQLRGVHFNPFAASAGARGIAQFMPGTRRAYGLGDPLDPAARSSPGAPDAATCCAEFDGSAALASRPTTRGPER